MILLVIQIIFNLLFSNSIYLQLNIICYDSYCQITNYLINLMMIKIYIILLTFSHIVSKRIFNLFYFLYIKSICQKSPKYNNNNHHRRKNDEKSNKSQRLFSRKPSQIIRIKLTIMRATTFLQVIFCFYIIEQEIKNEDIELFDLEKQQKILLGAIKDKEKILKSPPQQQMPMKF
ncbi:hypothetical protein pb186bvf_011258 [Paramecium bursaria]